MLGYAVKRVLRGYRLFVALTIGVLIATTFFSSMVISADVLSKEAVTQELADVDYDARVQANNVTWSAAEFADVEQTLEGLPEVLNADRYTKFSYAHNASPRQTFNVVGLQPNSTAWHTLSNVNGTTVLAANETYVVAGSTNASYLLLGQELHANIRVFTANPPYTTTFKINLTVAGFVDIPSRTARLLSPPRYLDFGFIQIELGNWRDYNLLIVDWDLTIAPVIDWYSSQENVSSLAVESGFYCQLDRNSLVNPYDIGGSSTAVSNAIAKIEDRTAAFNTQVTNLLGSTLSMLSLRATGLVVSFVALAAPVIFMAWYSSTMLSDVSYNLRRREFGLLQTKGFGPKSIKRMLMLEGAIVGLIGGVAGLVIGTVLAYIIVGVAIQSLPVVLAANPFNSVVIVVFALIMAVWSVRGPADRAAKLDPLDSLKQYIYIEEQREYKRLLPTIALVLGTYKIIAWALGINMGTLLASALSTNFILLIVVALWTPVDAFLNYVGPIFFLYGAAKILLRGSQKFQELVTTAGSRFFGAFGRLATRNVSRHPARNAALVFVVALIVSYGLYSIGSLFSQQDLLERNSLFNVGSDVSADFPSGENMSAAVESIGSIDGVSSVALEYELTMSSTRGGLEVRGIDPDVWPETAFYETDWFSGSSFQDMLSNFTGEKIILSVTVARQLDLRLGNLVALKGPGQSTNYRLEIIGFVGYRSPLESILGSLSFAFGGSYPSYVPIDFLNDSGFIDMSVGRVLMKTLPGTNGTVVEQEISAILPQVTSTNSFTSRMMEAQTNRFDVGGTRSRWVGVAFAVVLAIVGTGLVVSLTLKEKEYETTLLGVRGLTRGQILKALIAEVMVMVLFALLLGVGTGFIQLFGDIANTSQAGQQLVRPRMVFSLLSVTGMSAIVLCVVLAALIPVLWTSRFTEQKVNVLRE